MSPWAVLALVGATLIAAPAAQADTAPPVGTPATVSADALPTWQVDGVVWASVTVGNNVYVTGSFTKARPPGAAVGDPREVPAENIFGFDIRTGNPLPDFKHSLNGPGLSITASPDGRGVYVGGQFTRADGQAHNRLAAYSLVTGNLRRNFIANADASVRALTATNETVYAGGNFTSFNHAARAHLAAMNTDGTLTTWAPTADDNAVTSVVVAPAGDRVIVGGHFTTLNGKAAYGMGALDARTGATKKWKANRTIRAAARNGAITSLRTDGKLIYGSAYTLTKTASNFEGTFAANPADGRLVWVNDCHGDTYGVLPIGRTLYTVGHAHDCQPIGAFPDIRPPHRVAHRALAFDTASSGAKNTGPDKYKWDFSAFDHSTLLHWYPDLRAGTFTGQSQAAWSVTGNARYVVLGGEFPSVNGKAQQGLTRFGVKTVAPNKMGPTSTQAQLKPTVATAGAGKLKITWPVTWDRDNRLLEYNVLRDDEKKPIAVLDKNSSFWQLGTMNVTDSKLAKGSSHTYRVQAVDPFDNPKMSLPSDPVTVQ